MRPDVDSRVSRVTERLWTLGLWQRVETQTGESGENVLRDLPFVAQLELHTDSDPHTESHAHERARARPHADTQFTVTVTRMVTRSTY